MIWLLLIFFGIGLIGGVLILISTTYQDKDFEKAHKLCQTGISIVIFDLLALCIIGICLFKTL